MSNNQQQQYISREKASSEFFWTTALTALSMGCVIGADWLISNASSYLPSAVSSTISYDSLRPLVSYGHFLVGVPVVLASLFIKSPYGRHTSKAAKEGKALTLPAVRSWIIQESPTLLAFAYYNFKYGLAPIMLNPASILFAIHYVNRVLVFPLLLGKGTPQPIWVTLSALSYCVFNGALQNGIDAKEAASVSTTTATSSVLSSLFSSLDSPVVAALGVALFAVGMTSNIIADRHLISLKEKHNTYVIPRHFLFTHISCPNFFFEALEWLGFTVATAGCCGVDSSKTLAAASFCFFTVCNTWMRAIQHHQWYHEKFGDEYKKLGRKAVLPFIL